MRAAPWPHAQQELPGRGHGQPAAPVEAPPRTRRLGRRVARHGETPPRTRRLGRREASHGEAPPMIRRHSTRQGRRVASHGDAAPRPAVDGRRRPRHGEAAVRPPGDGRRGPRRGDPQRRRLEMAGVGHAEGMVGAGGAQAFSRIGAQDMSRGSCPPPTADGGTSKAQNPVHLLRAEGKERFLAFFAALVLHRRDPASSGRRRLVSRTKELGEKKCA